MDDDLRSRFRNSGRRDYVGPMPERPRPAEQAIDNYDESDIFLPAEPPRKPKKEKTERPKRRKRAVTAIIILLLGVVGGGVYWKLILSKPASSPQQSTQTKTSDSTQVQSTQTDQAKKTVRFVATGDMIAHSAILERAKQPNGSYDFSSMLANMKPYFAKSDVSFCNQATPAGGASFGYTGYPVFNAPIEWPRAIEGVGCNVINIGSNHTNDRGQALIDATVAAWDGRPVLAVVGANRNAEEQAKIRYFEKGGVKFAIFSYSTYTNAPLTTPYGINMYNKVSADAQIAEANKNADIVIVSMRWGTEYSPGINPQQDLIAQELSNAGADIIVGHGPHSMEPVKKLKGTGDNDTIVWFSLGNFLNAQLEIESLIGGFAIMDIDVATKKVSDPQFMPIYVHYEWTPAEKAANSLLARRNFSMYPLDQAAEPMSKSQIGTTMQAQTDRVTKLLNTYTPVTIISSAQF